MSKIEHALRSDSANHIVTLQGISGIGKTHIALAYVMRNLNAYSGIFWLDASDEHRLAWSHLEMAKRITLDHDWVSDLHKTVDSHETMEAIIAIKRWLSLQGKNRWLLVYDCYEPHLVTEAGDQTNIYDLKDFLPEILQEHIMITTTKPGMDLGVQISVGKLRSTEHSLGILSQASERQDIDQEQSIRDLIVELDGLPQALVTAQWHELEGVESLHVLPAHLTWGVTMKEIARKHEDAAYLAYYWSIFSNHHIWPSLLQHTSDIRLVAIGREFQTFFNVMRVLCDYGVAELIDLRVMGQDMRNNERYARIYSNLAEYYMAASQWVTGTSPGTRALLRCGSGRAHRSIAKWYADHLNNLYLSYPEKRHLAKIERLCLLGLEVAAKAPAGDRGKYMNIKVKLYNMLREVYDIRKKLFKASRCDLALLRLDVAHWL
ncbi:hypothetical protein BDV19DRAFT_383877 [Aspergillus venezuelensis]